MRVAIHQPNFLPRLKVLQKLAAADLWVALDCVQYAKSEWQNRTRITPLSGNGAPFWLTLPVHLSEGRETKISDVEIVDLDYTIQTITHSIYHAFRASIYWSEVSNYWDECKSSIKSPMLEHVSCITALVALKTVGVNVNVVNARDVATGGKGSKLMANICDMLGASAYLADSGATGYLRYSDFKTCDILWQHWEQPNSDRSWRDFSFLDYFATYGLSSLRNHIRSGTFFHTPPIQAK